MDQTTTPTTEVKPTPLPETPAPTKPETVTQIKKGGGAFSVLGKIFIFLIIGSSLLLGGYYFGMKSSKTTQPMTPTPSTAASPSVMVPSPTMTTNQTKTVKAGLSGGNFFKPYTIDVPIGWTNTKETTVAAGIDKLILTKNGYSLTIYQAAMGGGGCIYPGDKPAEMSQTFTAFADINGKNGQFRRSWNEQGAAKTLAYTVCLKGTDNSYGVLTPFGAISIATPNPAEPSILAEIDSMIASLTKQ